MKKVTAIFDVGKTNKKLLLFDLSGRVLHEATEQFELTTDDDGDPCENVQALTQWIRTQWQALLASKKVSVTGVNFTAYGASFVHIDGKGNPVTPLYDYMKPVPGRVQKEFYAHIKQLTGLTRQQFARTTCSPAMGLINSGLQLYWIKNYKPTLWKQIHTSLHLPQYLAFIISGKWLTDYTSLGCHTGLWDFDSFRYARWVRGDIAKKLAPITTQRFTYVTRKGQRIKVGCGLHDSSAALLPYRHLSAKPFILISTGTWSIQLNPFDTTPLTTNQLRKDCLRYLQPHGQPVKASRLLLGREYDYQVNRIAKHFHCAPDFFQRIEFDEHLFLKVCALNDEFFPACMHGTGPRPALQTSEWNLAQFGTAQACYHCLLLHLVGLVIESIQLINPSQVETIYVDGGFARNTVFMKILALMLPQKKIVAASLPQATARGAFQYLHNRVGE
ncbi:MAG: carbohydrate kinase [Cytophagales bacterium]|nr:carbohydrate kinase [Cytophagales bacterium]